MRKLLTIAALAVGSLVAGGTAQADNYSGCYVRQEPTRGVVLCQYGKYRAVGQCEDGTLVYGNWAWKGLQLVSIVEADCPLLSVTVDRWGGR